MQHITWTIYPASFLSMLLKFYYMISPELSEYFMLFEIVDVWTVDKYH